MMKLINPMKDSKDMLKNAELVINERLKSIPKMPILLQKGGEDTLGPDFILSLKRPNNPTKILLFEVKNNGQPREARQVIHQIQEYARKGYSNSYGVMVAPYISEQTAGI